MKVVIADDEKYILVVIKSVLEEIEIPIEIVGEALDGSEAYELCKSQKPDFLLTDICMPGGDGLSLIQKVRQDMPQLPVIILSGYDDFQYAKAAIHFGVEEYLLKPIDAEEMYLAISRIREKQENTSNMKLAEMFSDMIHMLPENGITLQEGAVKSGFFEKIKGKVLTVLAFSDIDCGEQERMKTFIDNPCIICYDYDETIGVLTLLHNQEKSSEQIVISIKNDISCRRLVYASKRLDEVKGLQNYGNSFIRLHQVWIDLYNKVSNFFWNNIDEGLSIYNRSICVLCEKEYNYFESYNDEKIELLLMAIKLQKRDVFQKLSREYYQRIIEDFEQGNPIEIKRLIKNLIGREMLLLNFNEEVCHRIASYRNKIQRINCYEAVCQEFLNCQLQIFTLYGDINHLTASDGVKDVMENYITQHYMENVTLTQFAAFLHFNESYTSDLFKKLFGVNFVTYINNLKIEKAKQLLKSGQFKVYEISKQVGYEDVRYFMKLFKKVTGHTPKEFSKYD